MTFPEVIQSLEQAHTAVGRSLEMMKELMGAVAAATGATIHIDDRERYDKLQEAAARHNIMLPKLAKRIVRRAKKKPGKHARLKKNELQRRWREQKKLQREKKTPKPPAGYPPPPAEEVSFGDAAIQVLGEAGKPLYIDDLETGMRALGWTTKSANTRGLFSVQMPTVKGVKKVAPLTWALKKNGNGS